MDPRNRNIEPSFFFILKNPKKRKETRHTHTYSNKRRAPYSRGRLCNKLSSRTGRPTGPLRIERYSPPSPSLQPQQKSIICWDETAEFVFIYFSSPCSSWSFLIHLDDWEEIANDIRKENDILTGSKYDISSLISWSNFHITSSGWSHSHRVPSLLASAVTLPRSLSKSC